MSLRRALQVVLAIAIAGAAFSGYLSWRELFAAEPGCGPVGAPSSILGYPPCVYGLAMYTALVVVALAGLRSGTHPGAVT